MTGKTSESDFRTLWQAAQTSTARTGHHDFERYSLWRFYLCKHCYLPRSLHPVTVWTESREVFDTTNKEINDGRKV